MKPKKKTNKVAADRRDIKLVGLGIAFGVFGNISATWIVSISSPSFQSYLGIGSFAIVVMIAFLYIFMPPDDL